MCYCRGLTAPYTKGWSHFGGLLPNPPTGDLPGVKLGLPSSVVGRKVGACCSKQTKRGRSAGEELLQQAYSDPDSVGRRKMVSASIFVPREISYRFLPLRHML